MTVASLLSLFSSPMFLLSLAISQVQPTGTMYRKIVEKSIPLKYSIEYVSRFDKVSTLDDYIRD